MFLVFQDVYLRLAVRISASVLVAALFGPVKGTDGGSAFSQKQENIFWSPHPRSDKMRALVETAAENQGESSGRRSQKFIHDNHASTARRRSTD